MCVSISFFWDNFFNSDVDPDPGEPSIWNKGDKNSYTNRKNLTFIQTKKIVQ